MRKRYLITGSVMIIAVILYTAYTKSSPSQSILYESLNETVEDIDGNRYQTVRIGDQIWMSENLKATHYQDGTPIPNVYDNEKWPRATEGAYCMVNNDAVGYKKTYGVLYNFYAITNRRQLCPKGWHVPTREECVTLIHFLGGNQIAGKKIKDNRGNLWKNKEAEATNESGFSGLPAGGRGQFGSPGDVGYYATWWSSTSSSPFYAWHWGVFPDQAGIRSNPGHKSSGFSIRCIKDN